MSSKAVTTFAKTWTSSSIPCSAPGELTAPVGNCMSTTRKSTIPRGLRLACTQLNIELLHRPPRDPPPGGLVERIIQTTQDQFEAEVRAGKVLTLAELNHYYQAWLHMDYHATTHRETGQTPQARYEETDTLSSARQPAGST